MERAAQCRFEVDDSRTEAFTPNEKGHARPASSGAVTTAIPSNIDEQKIIDALVAMPIHGNDDGLIPNFNVYLANLPADFYNLVSLRFVDPPAKGGYDKGRGKTGGGSASSQRRRRDAEPSGAQPGLRGD